MRKLLFSLLLLICAPLAHAGYCDGVPKGESISDVAASNCIKLPGTFTFATLPNSTSIKIGTTAYTSDQGTVVLTALGWSASTSGSSHGQLLDVVVLTAASGTYTPNLLANTLSIIVLGDGGGGGGCAAATSNFCAAGGGGAGGLFRAVLPVNGPYTYTIGQGGTGGAAGFNSGSAGSGTQITDASAFQIVACTGGNFGFGANAGTTPIVKNRGPGGSCVTTLVGAFALNGEEGGSGLSSGVANSNVSGKGGGTIYGAGGLSQLTNNNGVSPVVGNYGGGGSGALTSNSTTARSGGNGAPGVIVIYEYT